MTVNRRVVRAVGCLLGVIGLVVGAMVGPAAGSEVSTSSSVPVSRVGPPPFVANYAATLREAQPRADGINHVDTPRMIQQLKRLHVTTYWYLVWYTPTEWQDFVNEFEPAAERAGIDIYVYLVGPSECSPICSEPYGTDYVAWAQAIADLSLQHPNIKGWAIDDFIYNLSLFTPSYMKQVVGASHTINPGLRFYAQIYQNNLTPDFTSVYTPIVDGYVLAFRDDPWHNTQVTSSLPGQIERDAALVHSYGKNLVLMVYAYGLSDTPMFPSASYIDTCVRIGLAYLRAGVIAGVVTYVLKMDGLPEPPNAFNHAPTHGGIGRLSLATRDSSVAGYEQASQQFTVDPSASDYSLDFWLGLHYLADASNGKQAVQLLVDGKLAWQTDPASLPSGSYEPIHVDLTPYLAGKNHATLALRLATVQPEGSFIADVSIDDLQGTGLTVTNPGFESAQGWTLTHTNPAYYPAIDIFDTNRALEAFADVTDQFGPHALVIRAATGDGSGHPDPLLLAIADKVLVDYLAHLFSAAATNAQTLSSLAAARGDQVLAEQSAGVADDLTHEA